MKVTATKEDGSGLGTLTRAVRNVSRRKVRTLLVVIALGFSMAIMISIPAGVVANQNSTQGLSENYDATITNMQEQINQSLTLIQCSLASESTPGSLPGSFPGFMPRYMSGLNEEFMNESIASNITSIQGVEAVVPVLQKSVGTTENVTRFDRTFSIFRADYTIVGIPLNSSLIDTYPILPTNITEGRNLQNGDSGAVVLSLNNTEYFGVDVGGTVSINGSDFTVVGVHGTTGFTQATTLYMNILDAQRVTNHTEEISRLDVYATSSSEVDAVVSEISSMYPELSVTTSKDILTQLQNMQQRYTEMLNNAQSTLAQTQSTATQLIIIAVVATSLIVLFVMLYTVRERTKEIGTLKAIGFSNCNVMIQFMLEGILISLIAGAVGIVVGSVGAPIITSLLLPHVSIFATRGAFQGPDQGTTVLQTSTATVTIDPQFMLLSFGIAVLLGALGSLYPSWRASRTSPMEALKYE